MADGGARDAPWSEEDMVGGSDAGGLCTPTLAPRVGVEDAQCSTTLTYGASKGQQGRPGTSAGHRGGTDPGVPGVACPSPPGRGAWSSDVPGLKHRARVGEEQGDDWAMSPLTERGTSPTRGSRGGWRERLKASPYAVPQTLRDGGKSPERGAGGKRSSSAQGGLVPGLNYFQLLRASPTPTSRSWSPGRARRVSVVCGCPPVPHEPFDQRTSQPVYGSTSSLGVQYVSAKRTAPTVSFGSGARDDYRKVLYLSEDHSRMQQPCSPAVHTYLGSVSGRSAFGEQAVAAHGTSPRPVFLASPRFPDLPSSAPSPRRVPAPPKVPGPGAYNTAEAQGAVTRRDARVAVGKAPRFSMKPTYISAAHSTAAEGPYDTPRCTAYEAPSSLGPQASSTRKNTSSATLKSGVARRLPQGPSTPSPYSGALPGQMMGSDPAARKVGFAKSTRDGRERLWLSADAERALSGLHVGGPGAGKASTDFAGSGRGLRALSPNRNAPGVAVCKEKRFAHYTTCAPGPGAYFLK